MGTIIGIAECDGFDDANQLFEDGYPSNGGEYMEVAFIFDISGG
jgi:hypothetical protein